MAMVIKKMDTEEFLEFLKQKQGEQSLNQFAKALGVSPSYLSMVYNGHRAPGESITSALNVERISVYTITQTNSEEKK